MAGQLITQNSHGNLSLEELWAIADKLGRLRIGTFGDDKQAELRLSLGEDNLYIRSGRRALKDNIAEVIERAQEVKEFYRQAGYL